MTLLFAGPVLLGALLFSGALRAKLRVLISKHLFSYRYDYRNEWLRFTQALSAADSGLDLGQSVIRALSDLAGGNALFDFTAFVEQASATSATILRHLLPVL